MTVYKEIRSRFLEGESERQIAKDLNISRNTVRRYKEGANCPWERKRPTREARVLTEEVVDFIRQCLQEDERENVKKQKHTAKRIYERLVEEKGYTGGASTVRRKVHEIKGTISKAFVPLQFDPGEAIQVDWGQGVVYLAGERTTINFFCARLCYSCKPVVWAYTRQNEESFLEAIVKTFEELGGVTKKVIFDNAKVAVKKGYGVHAEKQAGYAALSAHYGFEAVFCNPASGHEKGLVEGLVGWARRNILVPLVHVETMRELNEKIQERCDKYEEHQIKGRPKTVGFMFEEERTKLRPLPLYAFEIAKCLNARVSEISTVRFQSNEYSVPVKYIGYNVGIKGLPEVVKVCYEGKIIAEHKRLYGKNEKSCRLADYLPLLEDRGRAILNAVPVKQNLSTEAYEELKANIHDSQKVRDILYREASVIINEEKDLKANDGILNDEIKIKKVDLHIYDELMMNVRGV